MVEDEGGRWGRMGRGEGKVIIGVITAFISHPQSISLLHPLGKVHHPTVQQRNHTNTGMEHDTAASMPIVLLTMRCAPQFVLSGFASGKRPR
jgi:hypothetical protein